MVQSLNVPPLRSSGKRKKRRKVKDDDMDIMGAFVPFKAEDHPASFWTEVLVPETAGTNDSKGKKGSCVIDLCADEGRSSWTPVDLMRSQIGNAYGIHEHYKKHGLPFVYALAYDMSGIITDVFNRYCRAPGIVRRDRLSKEDFAALLRSFGSSARSEEEMLEMYSEQAELARAAEFEPMPTSKAKFLNHPMYCLHSQLKISKYPILLRLWGYSKGKKSIIDLRYRQREPLPNGSGKSAGPFSLQSLNAPQSSFLEFFGRRRRSHLAAAEKFLWRKVRMRC